MPSVFTIAGADMPVKKSKKARRALGSTSAQVGDCKTVTNSKTGCSMQLCFVGKSSKSKSGWAFQKGTSSCPARRR